MDLFNQPQTGEQLKQEGIAQAIKHADEVVPTWSEKAFAHFVKFVIQQRDDSVFRTEDIRAYAEGQRLEIPPTKRAWGAVTLRAVREGYIKREGFTTSDNPKTHKGIITLWRKVNQSG
jgi:hypothetical protein